MKYLGVDWGMKKIGLAVSEGEVAQPFKTLEIGSLSSGINQLTQVIMDKEVGTVVLGQPEGGKMHQSVDKAAQLLRQQGVEVCLVDETLSTQRANRLMIEMKFSQKARRDDNSISAAIILQGFLDDQKK